MQIATMKLRGVIGLLRDSELSNNLSNIVFGTNELPDLYRIAPSEDATGRSEMRLMGAGPA